MSNEIKFSVGQRVVTASGGYPGTIKEINGDLHIVQLDGSPSDTELFRFWGDELDVLPTSKYQTDEIVIIETHDCRLGAVKVPAIIRFYDPSLDIYEVNVLLPAHRHAADSHDISWWTIKESEIVQSLGKAVTENPTEGDYVRKAAGFDN